MSALVAVRTHPWQARSTLSSEGASIQPVDLDAFIIQLAQRSGEAIRPFFRTRLRVADKAGDSQFDPVTEADRAAETVIRQSIEAQFPLHGIVGEEFGAVRGDAEFVWVIDPIDGTRAFVCGLPTWGTLIGLLRNGAPVLGLMNQPFVGECFHGDGRRARWRMAGETKSLTTRSRATLEDAYLACTTPAMFSGEARDRFDALSLRCRLTRYGTDCYAYAMLAAGQIDLVVEAGLKPYDIVALIPIIEGAGGVVTDWRGGPATQGGAVVAAGSRALHEKALEHLSG